MRHVRAGSGLAILLLLGAPAAADPAAGSAAPVATARPERHHRLSFQFGLGAPLGILGAAWAYAPREHFRVEAGVGLGATSVQLSLMPGVAFGSTSDRFVAGAGVAAGVLDFRCPCYWINVDAAGYEHVYDGGFTLFVAAGITMPMQDTTLNFWGSTRLAAFVPLPQLKFGFGWW